MKLLKLGIAVLIGLGLIGCTPVKIAELTEAMIQRDARVSTKFIDEIDLVQAFSISSDKTDKYTRIIQGTLTVVTSKATVTGDYYLNYTQTETKWDLKFGQFTPKSYTNIDPQSFPTNQQIRNDLLTVSGLPSNIKQVDSLEYVLEKPSEDHWTITAQMTVTNDEGKITGTAKLDYVYSNFQWSSTNKTFTFGSITDITSVPDEKLIWELIEGFWSDTYYLSPTTDFKLISSVGDPDKGVMVSLYHADRMRGVIRILSDMEFTSTYTYGSGWSVELTKSNYDLIWQLTGSYRMSWETISDSETLFTKGEIINIDLNGNYTYSRRDDVETRSVTATGTVTIKGVTYSVTVKTVPLGEIAEFVVELDYGSNPKQKIYLGYGYLTFPGELVWFLQSADHSEGLIHN